MATQWYCLIDGQEYGPYSSEELRIMAQNGQMQPADSVRRDRQAPWKPAANVKGLFGNGSADVSPAEPSPAKSTVTEKPSVAEKPPVTGKPPVAKPVVAATRPEAQPTSVKPPVAKAVAVAPAAIPVGKAVSPAVVIAPVSPGPSLHAEDSHLHARTHKRGSHTMYVVAGLGGLMLALLCFAIFVMTWSGSEPAEPTVAAGHAETDPAIPTDPEVDPGNTGESADVAGGISPALLKATTWLDASSQKGGLRSLARFHVAEARLEQTSAGDKVLKLEIHVRNDDRENAMEFKTWNASDDYGDALAALLFDPEDKCLKPAPTTAVPGVRAAAIRVNPGETVTQELAFQIPAGTQQDYRLLLPYAAIGRRGQIGFEVPGIMIKTLSEDEATQVAEGEKATEPAGTDVEAPPQPVETVIGPEDEVPANETPAAVPEVEPENPFDMDVLRRSIEETAGGGGEADAEKPKDAEEPTDDGT